MNAYQQQVLAHLELLNHLARRRFPERGSAETSNLALEGQDYVLSKLEEDDWSKVRQYRGRSSFEAFLAQTARRLLEDFARHKFHYLRVPARIKRLGPLWERTYKKLCWEQLPAFKAIDQVRNTLTKDHDPEVLKEIEAAIRGGILHCGAGSVKRIEPARIADLPEPFDQDAVADPVARTPEDWAAAEQRVRLLQVIAGLLDPEHAAGPVAEPDDGPLAGALRKLRDTLLLAPEERLLLRLVFQEGMTVTDAGKRLGLSVHSVQGKMRRLLRERIRSAFKAAGLDQALAELLEGEDSEF